MYDREGYEWCKARGICPHCQKRKARPGRTTCAECGASNSASARLSYARMTPEERDAYKARVKSRRRERLSKLSEVQIQKYYEQSREYERQRREGRKAAGLCVRCGKATPRPGRTTCEACAARIAEYTHRAYLKQKENKHGEMQDLRQGSDLCADVPSKMRNGAAG